MNESLHVNDGVEHHVDGGEDFGHPGAVVVIKVDVEIQ